MKSFEVSTATHAGMTGENQLDLQFGEVLKHLGMSQLLMEDIIYPRASVEDHKFPEEWYETINSFYFTLLIRVTIAFSKRKQPPLRRNSWFSTQPRHYIFWKQGWPLQR